MPTRPSTTNSSPARRPSTSPRASTARSRCDNRRSSSSPTSWPSESLIDLKRLTLSTVTADMRTALPGRRDEGFSAGDDAKSIRQRRQRVVADDVSSLCVDAFQGGVAVAHVPRKVGIVVDREQRQCHYAKRQHGERDREPRIVQLCTRKTVGSRAEARRGHAHVVHAGDAQAHGGCRRPGALRPPAMIGLRNLNVSHRATKEAAIATTMDAASRWGAYVMSGVMRMLNIPE